MKVKGLYGRKPQTRVISYIDERKSNPYVLFESCMLSLMGWIKYTGLCGEENSVGSVRLLS